MKKVLFSLVLALTATTYLSAAATKLYCQMPYDWWWANDGAKTAAISIYAYGEGNVKNADWPGQLMTEVDATKHEWSIDIDLAGYTHIIFARSSNANDDWGAKTGDLPISEIGTKNLYVITSETAVWGDPGCAGKWGEFGKDEVTPGSGGGGGGETPATNVIVKVKKPATWEKIAAYAWATGKQDKDLLGSWPGKEMQALGGDWYGLYVPANVNLIVNNNNNGQQANDYVVTAAVCLENIADKTDPTVADCTGVKDPDEGYTPVVDPAKDVVIKVKKLADWTGLAIWAWGSTDATWMAQFTGWPGVAMTALGNDWYSFTVKDDATFMFNDGVEGTSNKSQATKVSEATCYTISTETELNGENQPEHKLVVVDCATVDPNPQAIQQVESNQMQSIKIMRDGQLYILRDGKIYNALGIEM